MGGRVEWIRVQEHRIVVLSDNGLINVHLSDVESVAAGHISAPRTVATALGFPLLAAIAIFPIALVTVP